jgi:6-phosphofructokinase 2
MSRPISLNETESRCGFIVTLMRSSAHHCSGYSRRAAAVDLFTPLDITSATDRIVAAEKLRCTVPRHDPGGGGINVARAVRALGGDAMAVFAIGGLVGQRLRQPLDEEQVPVLPVTIAGLNRESFTIDERQTGRQFRFVMPGSHLSALEQERCLDIISSLEPRPRYVVGSGSLPPGVSSDFYGRLAKRTKILGARLIVDTSGDALRQAGCNGIYLLKPNLRELQQLPGYEINDES